MIHLPSAIVSFEIVLFVSFWKVGTDGQHVVKIVITTGHGGH